MSHTNFFRGRIINYIQFLNQYEVQVDNGLPVNAGTLNSGSLGMYGARVHNIYSIGQEVLLYKDSSMLHAVILGAVPRPVNFPGYNIPNWIQPQSAVGLKDDNVHLEDLVISNTNLNFNNGMPYDVFQGEWGVSNPQGITAHIGFSSFTFKASEMVGVSGFYIQNLLRLSGYNYQFWSAAGEHIVGDDQGELYDIKTSSPFIWETKGVLTPGDTFTTKSTAGEYDPTTGFDPLWETGNQSDRFEPKFDDQMPINRHVTFNGYFGDISKEIVAVPPPTLQDGVERLKNKTNYTGLSSVEKHSDGLIELRSLKGINLVKDCYIPVPKQISSTTVDGAATTDSYKFSGQFGNGDAHDKTPPKVSDDFLQLFDKLAYVRNKLSLQTFYRRPEWYVSKEAEDSYKGANSVDKNVYLPASDKFKIPKPVAFNIPIDFRTGAIKFYKTRSGIFLNDDGSILIEDGYGGQIKMERGNITISCSGDFIVANGRSVNILAPKDINLTAGKCVDIVATASDMRLKSDKNLHVLAGNSKTGGLLLESRGEGATQDFIQKYGTDVTSNGVIIKATNGTAAVFGSQVYIRSTADDIIIDSNSGSSNVQTYALNTVNLITATTTLYGAKPDGTGSTAAVEYHDSSSVLFGQQGSFSSSAATNLMSGSLVVNSSITGIDIASQSGGELGAWGVGTANSINRALNTVSNALASRVTSLSSVSNTAGRPYADENSLGNYQLIKSLGFSFRIDDQYGVKFDDGFLVESRWQQISRIEGLSDNVWKMSDNVVLSPDEGTKTLPYPGYTNWTSKPLFGTVNNVYWTATNGEAYGLDPYKTDMPTPSYVTLEGNYITS